LRWTLEEAFTASFFKALIGDGRGAVEGPLGNPEAVREFERRFASVSDAVAAALHVDVGKAADFLLKAREAGSVTLVRAGEAHANGVAALLRSVGLQIDLLEIDPASLPAWRSDDARVFQELLHHRRRAGEWKRWAELVADDEFRSKLVRIAGHHVLAHEVDAALKATASDAEAAAGVDHLRQHLAVDDVTNPLLGKLGRGLKGERDQVIALLTHADAWARPGQTVVALRGLGQIHDLMANDLPPAEQEQLRLTADALLASPDKYLRWEAVHAYWKLTPRGLVAPLVTIAERETEHALIRAEAARQIAEADDPVGLAALRRLATAAAYPLRSMAARGVRRIEQGCRLAPVGAIQDCVQPNDMPTDLAAALKRAGADLTSERVPGMSMFNVIPDGPFENVTKVILHLILSSELSVDTRWREIEIIESVLREFPCRLLCVEGGHIDCSLTPMKKIASTEEWQAAGARFVHSLELAAEEYLQLTTDYDYRIQGVDDMEILSHGLQQKRDGKSGLELAGSFKRARTILDGTLAEMEHGHRVVLMVTQELPAYQIGVMLGGPRASMMESMLPEPVPEALVTRQPQLLYVPLLTEDPTGEVFGVDINYMHAVGN
jgi:hypothetical protein